MENTNVASSPSADSLHFAGGGPGVLLGVGGCVRAQAKQRYGSRPVVLIADGARQRKVWECRGIALEPLPTACPALSARAFDITEGAEVD